MSGYIFTRLGFEVPFDNAQYIDASKVSKVVKLPPMAQTGYSDWQLGGDVTSLTASDGAQLVLVDAATSLTWNATSVLLGGRASGYNGLSSPFTDSAEQTVCMVYKLDSEVSYVIGGTLTTSGGEGFQKTGAGILAYSYRRNSSRVTATALPLPANAMAGSYIFLAFSRSGSNAIAMVGGADNSLSLSAEKGSGGNVTVGNGNTPTSGYSKDCEVAEFLYKPSASTLDELKQVYTLTKARCEARGFSLV